MRATSHQLCSTRGHQTCIYPCWQRNPFCHRHPCTWCTSRTPPSSIHSCRKLWFPKCRTAPAYPTPYLHRAIARDRTWSAWIARTKTRWSRRRRYTFLQFAQWHSTVGPTGNISDKSRRSWRRASTADTPSLHTNWPVSWTVPSAVFPSLRNQNRKRRKSKWKKICAGLRVLWFARTHAMVI